MTAFRILFALAGLALFPWTAIAQTGGSDLKAFVGFRLVDVDRGAVVEDAAMVVRGGRIEAIGRRRSVRLPAVVAPVDLKGAYVLPGLISTHVHVSDVDGDRPRAYTAANTKRQLGVFARYGVTTVLSLDGEKEPAFAARDAQSVPSLDRARLFVAGSAIVGKTPEEARQMVATVAALRPDIIKIRVDDNLGTTAKMAPEVYRAVIDEAHRRGLRVAAHLFYLDDAKALLRAGVDMIAHSVRDREIDDEFIGLMKARKVPYCPTLTRDLSTFIYESTPEFFADPFFLREADPGVVARLQEPARQKAMQASASAQRYKTALAVARRNLERASKAGVLVAMGTDAGPFPERFQGYFEHLELVMMAESGLTPAQVLRAATSDAARAIKVGEVGSLVRGAWADFVALDRNPLEDIRNTRSMTAVWIAGNLVPPRPPPASASGSLEAMADAERAFAAAAAERGVRAAFLEYLDADAVDLEPSPRPARDVWMARPVPANPLATTLSWEPRTGDIAASGELGWLTGPFTVVPDRNASKTAYGCYFSVWRQRAGQPWRVLLDYGTPTREPCEFAAPGFVAAAGGAGTPGTRESLLAADRAIGDIPAAEWRVRAPAVFAEDARLHRPGLQPMVGRAAIAAYAAAHSAPRQATTLDGDVSAAGDMGYTYGRLELDGGAAATAHYLRVWRRRGSDWTSVAEVQKPGN